MYSLIIAFVFCVLVLAIVFATFKYGGFCFEVDPTRTPNDASREDVLETVQPAAQANTLLEGDSVLSTGVKVINIAWNPEEVRRALKEAKQKWRNQ